MQAHFFRSAALFLVMLHNLKFDLPNQLVGRYTKGLGDFEDRVDSGASQTTFDFTVVRPVKTRKTTQNLLGQTFFLSETLNHSPDLFCADHDGRTPFCYYDNNWGAK